MQPSICPNACVPRLGRGVYFRLPYRAATYRRSIGFGAPLRSHESSVLNLACLGPGAMLHLGSWIDGLTDTGGMHSGLGTLQLV